MFLLTVEKRAPPVLYRDIDFKDCRHEVRSKLKVHPPAEKAAHVPAHDTGFQEKDKSIFKES